jgi:hypothetical protein
MKHCRLEDEDAQWLQTMGSNKNKRNRFVSSVIRLHVLPRYVQSRAVLRYIRAANNEAKTECPRILSRGTSINHLNRTCDVSSAVTKEKCNEASDLFRPTDPIQRYDVACRVGHGSFNHVFDLSDHRSINEAPTQNQPLSVRHLKRKDHNLSMRRTSRQSAPKERIQLKLTVQRR